MRAFDRDLIRGGHYGQRPREPRSKAEHMAAPTNAANVKKALANSEPSTHGPKRTWSVAMQMSATDPKATFGVLIENNTQPSLPRQWRRLPVSRLLGLVA